MVRYLFDLLWMLLKIEPFTTNVKSGIRKRLKFRFSELCHIVPRHGKG